MSNNNQKHENRDSRENPEIHTRASEYQLPVTLQYGFIRIHTGQTNQGLLSCI
jgi:hypothetical protein